MSLGFFFLVWFRTLCSAFAELEDAKDVVGNQLCLVLQEELACYKAKRFVALLKSSFLDSWCTQFCTEWEGLESCSKKKLRHCSWLSSLPRYSGCWWWLWTKIKNNNKKNRVPVCMLWATTLHVHTHGVLFLWMGAKNILWWTAHLWQFHFWQNSL